MKKTNYIQRPSSYMPIEELKKWLKENKLPTKPIKKSKAKKQK
jgi:hypothetical protein